MTRSRKGALQMFAISIAMLIIATSTDHWMAAIPYTVAGVHLPIGFLLLVFPERLPKSLQDMANDPEFLRLLLGFGLLEFAGALELRGGDDVYGTWSTVSNVAFAAGVITVLAWPPVRRIAGKAPEITAGLCLIVIGGGFEGRSEFNAGDTLRLIRKPSSTQQTLPPRCPKHPERPTTCLPSIQLPFPLRFPAPSTPTIRRI